MRSVQKIIPCSYDQLQGIPSIRNNFEHLILEISQPFLNKKEKNYTQLEENQERS